MTSVMSDGGNSSAVLPSLILYNVGKLRSLNLGVEEVLIRRYMACEVYDDTDHGNRTAKRLMTALANCFKEMSVDRPVIAAEVDNLKICGLDFHTLVRDQTFSLIQLERITCLTLESCCLAIDSLRLNVAQQLTNLQHFHIRQEARDTAFSSSLEKFLCVLPPLISLYIMLEGFCPPINYNGVFMRHGETLRNLIMDHREPDLTVVGSYTTRFQLGYTSALFNSCPNLRELGITILWDLYFQREGNYRKLVSASVSKHSVVLTVFTDRSHQHLFTQITDPQHSKPAKHGHVPLFDA